MLGPLATTAEPHTFDLCEEHAERLTVPRGWEVIRLQSRFDPAPPSADDLLALVEAIHEVAGRDDRPAPERANRLPAPSAQVQSEREDVYAPLRRRDHFTVIAGDGDRGEPDSEGIGRENPERGTFAD